MSAPDALPDPADLKLLADRHPSVQAAARWLVTNPNLGGVPAVVSRRFEACAARLLALVKADDPELTRALVLLTQAKDAAVRAAIAESDQA